MLEKHAKPIGNMTFSDTKIAVGKVFHCEKKGLREE